MTPDDPNRVDPAAPGGVVPGRARIRVALESLVSGPRAGRARAQFLTLVLGWILAGDPVFALGIGGLRLQSGLNQPLVGEIDLLDVRPDELDAVKVRIAPQADFNKAGAERYHYLTKLRFEPQVSPRGNAVIRLSTGEPVREPYMDFLVEVVWPQGRLVKQFTVLLDPPATASRAAPPVAPPVASARPAAPAPKPRASADAAPPAARSPQPASVPQAVLRPDAPGGSGFPRRFGPVRPGTGLWRLVRANTPAGATVAQTAMALYRSNPDAFISGDINRLSVGRTLTLPSAAELFAQSPEVARREFDAALRGDPVRRSSLADQPAPEGSTPAGEPRLRIAGAATSGDRGGSPEAGAGAGGGDGLEKELLLVRETSETAHQETVELRGRIRDLEGQLTEIRQLLRLRNEELARIQGQAGAAPGALAAGPGRMTESSGPDAAPPQGEAVPAQRSPDRELPRATLAGVPPDDAGNLADVGSETIPEDPGSPVTAAPVVAGVQVRSNQPGLEEPGAPTVPVTVRPPEPVSPTGSPAVPQAAAGATPAAIGTPVRAQAAAARVAEEDSAWQALLLPLAGVAGVTALGIGALMWLRARRRVSADGSLTLDSLDLSEDAFDQPLVSGLSVGTVAPDAAPARTDSAAVSGVGAGSPDSGPIGQGGPETGPPDFIAEAEIYNAYGRFHEAEELLRKALARTPDRMDLRFTLAETYHGAGNRGALEGLMAAIRAAGGDLSHPDQWQRLLTMTAETPAASGSAVGASPLVPPAAAGLSQAPDESLFNVLGEQDDGLDDLRLELPADLVPVPELSGTIPDFGLPVAERQGASGLNLEPENEWAEPPQLPEQPSLAPVGPPAVAASMGPPTLTLPPSRWRCRQPCLRRSDWSRTVPPTAC